FVSLNFKSYRSKSTTRLYIYYIFSYRESSHAHMIRTWIVRGRSRNIEPIQSWLPYIKNKYKITIFIQHWISKLIQQRSSDVRISIHKTIFPKHFIKFFWSLRYDSPFNLSYGFIKSRHYIKRT